MNLLTTRQRLIRFWTDWDSTSFNNSRNVFSSRERNWEAVNNILLDLIQTAFKYKFFFLLSIFSLKPKRLIYSLRSFAFSLISIFDHYLLIPNSFRFLLLLLFSLLKTFSRPHVQKRNKKGVDFEKKFRMEVPSFVGKACLKLKGLCVNVWAATLSTCQEREAFDEKVPPRAFRYVFPSYCISPIWNFPMITWFHFT